MLAIEPTMSRHGGGVREVFLREVIALVPACAQHDRQDSTGERHEKQQLPHPTLCKAQRRQPVEQAWQSRVPREHEHGYERDPHRHEDEAEVLRGLRVSKEPLMRIVPAQRHHERDDVLAVDNQIAAGQPFAQRRAGAEE
jgi:hypothetical protein